IFQREIFRGQLDHRATRIIFSFEAERGMLHQLSLPTHQGGDAFKWAIDQLGKVANERMIEILEMQLLKLAYFEPTVANTTLCIGVLHRQTLLYVGSLFRIVAPT